MPVNDLFDALRLLSANDSVTEIKRLVGPAPRRGRPVKGNERYRTGDAVNRRSVHAAMLNAMRLGVQFLG